jgi:DNA-binding FrmR family transcriptional regulator
MSSMKHESAKSCLSRLKRIEGQVRGIARMIEEERYCIEVITQIQAAKAALARVEEELLKDHVGTCVEHAIKSGNAKEQRQKISELVAVMSRTR